MLHEKKWMNEPSVMCLDKSCLYHDEYLQRSAIFYMIILFKWIIWHSINPVLAKK